MELGEIRLSNKLVGARCQFVAFAKHKFLASKLEEELRKRLYYGDDIAVGHEDQQPGGAYCYAYRITFSVKRLPLSGDLTIDMIMEHLDAVEQDVEKALRIKELAEMVE